MTFPVSKWAKKNYWKKAENRVGYTAIKASGGIVKENDRLNNADGSNAYGAN